MQTRFRQHYRAQMFVVAVLQQLAPSVRDNKAIVKSHVEQVFAAELSITKKYGCNQASLSFFVLSSHFLFPIRTVFMHRIVWCHYAQFTISTNIHFQGIKFFNHIASVIRTLSIVKARTGLFGLVPSSTVKGQRSNIIINVPNDI